MPMKIRLLEKDNKKDIRAFKKLPFRLYRGNPYWVPPFPGLVEKAMSPSRHPFYAHSEADFFLSCRRRLRSVGEDRGSAQP